MNTDNMTVFVLLSFLLAVAHCTDLQSTANSDEETRVEPIAQPTNIIDEHADIHESSTTVSERSGRQYYQPQAMFAYQQYPHRRAYMKPQSKKRPMRTKSGRRPGRPASRPRKQSPMSMQMSRYRRLPPPVRTQQVNYVDYGDGFESNANAASFDYEDPVTVNTAYMYGHAGHMAQATPPVAIVSSAGRSRKRPVAAATMSGYADESHETVVHVPVRVTRPTIPTVAVTVADPMNKLRQMVHEAMDEHFANRHQELYADGFDKQQVYSAKYKRQQTTAATATADKDKQQQRTPDAVKSTAVIPLKTSQLSETKTSDADADGSDDRLTLAQISAYMGAKPAETVLSAGGHRYVLSDALQQSYRQQQYQQPHQQQFQQQQVQQHYGGEDRHNNQQPYLRYVSPFEAIYDLPVARWTYK